MQTFTDWLGFFNQCWWIVLLIAVAMGLISKQTRVLIRISYRKIFTGVVILLIVYHIGLLISGYAVTLIPRGQIAIYLRAWDALILSLLTIWLILGVTKHVIIE